MPSEEPYSQTTEASPTRRKLARRIAWLGVGLLLAYLLGAYVLMPVVWKRYVRRHPSLDDVPGITQTADGIPGDPLNVALIGTETDVRQAMQAARWDPADALGLRSDLKIAADTVLRRQYDQAPVSNLYLWGRKEDLAFEQSVGDDPRQRHHVRFWRSGAAHPDGRPVWVGAAIYDQRVGLSRDTGQITHHTAADIDTEREKLFHDLQQAGELSEVYAVKDFHKTRTGRNGGGDPWHTDGDLRVGVIVDK